MENANKGQNRRERNGESIGEQSIQKQSQGGTISSGKSFSIYQKKNMDRPHHEVFEEERPRKGETTTMLQGTTTAP